MARIGPRHHRKKKRTVNTFRIHDIYCNKMNVRECVLSVIVLLLLFRVGKKIQ